jgi:tRNA(Ile)-lysidine synthase
MEIDADALVLRVGAAARSDAPELLPGRLALAVSGGADSCALAALICEAGLAARGSVAAHFDHGLRGEEAAARDAAAVAALCARYGLELESGAWPSPRRGEAAAREARYAFLRGAAERHGAAAIATGHTSDDQVETVLLHALRGAGLSGLRGMRACDALPGGGAALLRPLLGVTGAETRGFCAARGIAFEDDETNGDLSLLRNRVRLELLPRLEAMTAGARGAILYLAEEARAGVAALEEIASKALLEDAAGAAEVRLVRQGLRGLPEAARPYAFRLALRRLLGDVRDFDRRHYGLMAQAAARATGASYELPRGVVLTVDAEVLVLSRGRPGAPAIAASWEAAVPYAGAAGGWEIAVTRARDAAGADAIALPAGAVVRGRRAGDRIAPPGMAGHKKLQDYYVDRKVPRRERDAAPLIGCGGDVLWTPFGAARAVAGERYAVSARRMSLTSEG